MPSFSLEFLRFSLLNLLSIFQKSNTVLIGYSDWPPSRGLRSLYPARSLFLKEILVGKVIFSTSNHKSLDVATSKKVDGRNFTT